MNSNMPSPASPVSRISWMRFAQKARVPAGTALGVIFLLFMHPSVRSLMIGGVFTLAGALARIWAAGHIEKRVRLTRSGPYACTRNPLYFGSFLMALGVILAGQGYWLLPFFALFFIGVYFPVMRAEEQDLERAYGADFLEYARNTPLFFPKKPKRPEKLKTTESPARFSWVRVRKNREHRNLISLLAVGGILVFQLFFEPGYFVRIHVLEAISNFLKAIFQSLQATSEGNL